MRALWEEKYSAVDTRQLTANNIQMFPNVLII